MAQFLSVPEGHLSYADRVDSKELNIAYCPTEEMVADFFTKPLQGKLFYFLRDLIMGIGPNSKYHSSRRSVLSTDAPANDTRSSDEDVAGPRTYKEALLGQEST